MSPVLLKGRLGSVYIVKQKCFLLCWDFRCLGSCGVFVFVLLSLFSVFSVISIYWQYRQKKRKNVNFTVNKEINQQAGYKRHYSFSHEVKVRSQGYSNDWPEGLWEDLVKLKGPTERSWTLKHAAWALEAKFFQLFDSQFTPT